MPLVPAKCTNCGDTINVDDQKDAAICPSCGSAFIVDKAITNYNVSIKADKLEINADGITVDNLLKLAIDEMHNGNYAKAAENLTRALERDSSNLLLRPVRSYFGDILGAPISSLTAEQLQKACRLAQETYRLLEEWQDAWGNRKYADIFSQAVFQQHLKIFRTFDEYSVNSLCNKDTWPKTSEQYLQCAKTIDEFIGWGKGSGYFSDNASAVELPLERQLQNWADTLLSYLTNVSLCYHDDLSLSQQQAQLCYDMAEKYRNLCNHKQLSKRLIPPYKGGEGVHSHRLTDNKISDSVSDRRFFSQGILGGPSTEFISQNSSCLGSCALFGFIFIFLLLFVCALPDGGVAALLFILVILPGLYIGWNVYNDNENKNIRKKWIDYLFQQWRISPAQGTEAKSLAFGNFVIALEGQAQVRIKEMQK